MDVFDLFAKIVLDTGEYEKGLDGASQKTSSFGEKLKSGLATAAKVGTAAIGAASVAVGAFAKASVDTGMTFDSSMSQVAATMGTTVDEISELRDFAMEMGSKTAFSATEAADALNYMALAGYDAETSMSMLPNVLNLAAAGGIELASASDMITDSQSALGLSLDETSELVDKMAKASSKSNTSVAQLGDAILTVGGTAKTLAGGTTELSTALGILADNGVKGAEGGTALRNIILSLSAPTDKAAKSLSEMGVEVYDAAGNMRPLNETFEDLNAALSTMTQGEQTQALNNIFNKVDLKSVNALLANSGERFDELSGYINDAAGAAEQMANTQLDNLAGDITLFKSALEGAQIIVSDQLTPTLREFVQFGSKGISSLSDAFQEGGLNGAMSALGTILSDGIGMIVQLLPNLVEAGTLMIQSLLDGILHNIPMLAESALQIVVTLADGISNNLPVLIPAIVDAMLKIVDTLISNIPMLIQAAVKLITGLAKGLVEAIPVIIERLPEIIESIITGLIESLPLLIEAGVQLFVALVKNLPAIISGIVSALPEIVSAIVEGLSGLGGMLADLFSGAWEGIKSIWGGVSDFFSGIWDSIVQSVTEKLEIIKTLFPEAWEAIKSVWSTVTGFFENIGESIKQSITEKLEIIKIIFSTAWDAIKSVWSAVTGFFSGIWDGIKSIFSTVVDTFKGFFSKAWDGIKNAWSGVTDFFSGIWEKIKSVFSNAVSHFANIGKNIVQGIWDGISGMASWLWDKVSGFFSGIVDGVKDFLGIHSPSRVFAGIGENMALGLGAGWDDEFDSIRRNIEGAMDFSGTDMKLPIADFSVNGKINGYSNGTGIGHTAAQDNQVKQPVVIVVQLQSGLEIARQMVADINQLSRIEGARLI